MPVCHSAVPSVFMAYKRGCMAYTKGGAIAYYVTYKQSITCGYLRHLARTLGVPVREW